MAREDSTGSESVDKVSIQGPGSRREAQAILDVIGKVSSLLSHDIRMLNTLGTKHWDMSKHIAKEVFVLKLALIKAGVVTTEELETAEKELDADVQLFEAVDPEAKALLEEQDRTWAQYQEELRKILGTDADEEKG
jgi:hypothetical protein